MTTEFGTHADHSDTGRRPAPELVLCAIDEPMATAWRTISETARPAVRVHQGSILEIPAQAVVSPANSSGWMRGGIDAVYAGAFPDIEQRVRSAILAYHGGELPIGETVVVPTGVATPRWLISAPTMREPGELLPDDTVHPYLAARGVFLRWRDGVLDDGRPVRDIITTIAMPGLGTGVGAVSPTTCAKQVAAAWAEVFR